MSEKLPGKGRLLVAALVVVAVVAASRMLPVADWLDDLSRFAKGSGTLGLFVFASAYTGASLLFVPGAILTLAAGAAFGLALGTAVVSVASTLTAAIAFSLARHGLRERVNGWAAASPRFTAIDRAVGDGGWKVVALLRLSPAIPFSLSNYLFGLTPVAFVPYVLASWVAMLPGTVLYVYLGVVGRASAAAAAGAQTGKSPMEWAFLVVGLLATLSVTIYVTKLAQRRLRSQPEVGPT